MGPRMSAKSHEAFRGHTMASNVEESRQRRIVVTGMGTFNSDRQRGAYIQASVRLFLRKLFLPNPIVDQHDTSLLYTLILCHQSGTDKEKKSKLERKEKYKMSRNSILKELLKNVFGSSLICLPSSEPKTQRTISPGGR